jgi:hypothetical protein
LQLGHTLDELRRGSSLQSSSSRWAIVLGYHVASTITFLIDMSTADYAGGFKMLAHHLATCPPHVPSASVVLPCYHELHLRRPGNASLLRPHRRAFLTQSPVQQLKLSTTQFTRTRQRSFSLVISSPVGASTASRSTSFDKSSPGSVPICSSIRAVNF